MDVQDGVAHLRGEIDDPARIEEIVDLTKAVPGVTTVENLVHATGTDAPNKRTARSAGSKETG